MKKFLKNNKGFTLVEVIVVAVIVLILAAVAIPLYTSYMKEARVSVAKNTAATIGGMIVAGNQFEMAYGSGSVGNKCDKNVFTQTINRTESENAGSTNTVDGGDALTIECEDGPPVTVTHNTDDDVCFTINSDGKVEEGCSE